MVFLHLTIYWIHLTHQWFFSTQSIYWIHLAPQWFFSTWQFIGSTSHINGFSPLDQFFESTSHAETNDGWRRERQKFCGSFPERNRFSCQPAEQRGVIFRETFFTSRHFPLLRWRSSGMVSYSYLPATSRNFAEVLPGQSSMIVWQGLNCVPKGGMKYTVYWKL